VVSSRCGRTGLCTRTHHFLDLGFMVVDPGHHLLLGSARCVDRVGRRSQDCLVLAGTFANEPLDMDLADPSARNTSHLPLYGISPEPGVHERVVGCGVMVRPGYDQLVD